MSRVLAGRYEIRDRLGRGGMATVYAGFDRVLERDVAVKILSPDHTAEEGFVRRFRREAQAAASLNHRNAVAVHDTGSDGDEHFIVMELVEGPTLADVIAAEGPLAPDRVVEILDGVCAALGAAHERGLVHRDVKPGNVMFDADGNVKVADFGLARAVTGSTQTSTVYGSAPYMAPEQARGDDVDHRADIYALGCVLYEMLTARPPYEGDTPLAVVSQHLHADPPVPSQARPGVPERFDAVVATCLAKDPGDRYPDVSALLGDLESAASDAAPVTATQILETLPVGAAAAVPTPATSDTVRQAAPPPKPPPSKHAPEATRTSRWPARITAAVILLALAASAFLLFRALGDPAEDEPPPVAIDEAEESQEDEDPPPQDEPEEATGVTAVRNAAMDVIDLLDDGVERGQVGDKTRKDVGDRVMKVVEEARDGDWDDALKEVDEARKKLDERIRDRDVNTGWARQIHRELDNLERVVLGNHPSPSPSPSP